MKNYYLLLTSVLLFFAACGASDKSSGPDSGRVTSVLVPLEIEAGAGDEVTLTGKGFLPTDYIYLRGTYGEHTSQVIRTTADNATFAMPPGVRSGNYTLIVVRDDKEQVLGSVMIRIVVVLDIPDREGTNIKGKVYCDGAGVEGVVVSDGYRTTLTDSQGIYYLDSGKEHGYVFISLPGGYETTRIGAQPQFWQSLDKPVAQTEEKNFELLEVDNTDHTLLVMGDIHLANRTDDRRQFASFLQEAQQQADIHLSQGRRLYGLTLGDMTWELYWHTNNYSLPHFAAEIDDMPMAVFMTMGNHDHDMNFAGDWDTAIKYKQTLGPNYYSFNIGDIHYIVLDNIECTNDGTSDGRDYNNRIDPVQLEWLKDDLAHVDKQTPIVVAAHIPLHNESGTMQMRNGNDLLACFAGYPRVHFLTAHTHNNYNVEKPGVYEHNVGAVCATWWWTGRLVGNQVCKDGTPGGYMLWKADGTDVEWLYKGIGRSENYQFRTYDRNRIQITGTKYLPNATELSRTTFERSYAGDYVAPHTDNQVLINIWNWDSEWTLDVRENGRPLTAAKVSGRKDPLHIISYNAPRWNTNNTPTFPTGNCTHMFAVQASAPDSQLEITVTDRFGNTYRETMQRPKTINLNN